MHDILFKKLSEQIFVRKSGDPSDHGSISFPSIGTTARFITISDTSPAALILQPPRWAQTLAPVLFEGGAWGGGTRALGARH